MGNSDHDHALRTLDMARSDSTAVENMQDPSSFSDGVFGFHAQQAAEKALKAWIASLRLEYPKSHDLSALLRILAAEGIELSAYRDIEQWTVFAVQYRCEAYDDGEPLDRGAMLEKLRGLLADVAGAIGSQST